MTPASVANFISYASTLLVLVTVDVIAMVATAQLADALSSYVDLARHGDIWYVAWL